MNLSISDEDREKIARGNIERVLGLSFATA